MHPEYSRSREGCQALFGENTRVFSKIHDGDEPEGDDEKDAQADDGDQRIEQGRTDKTTLEAQALEEGGQNEPAERGE